MCGCLMREGRIILARGCGTADLDHDVFITPSTVFRVASVSRRAARVGGGPRKIVVHIHTGSRSF